ncbi:mechanosensitive ion channel family protein [Haliea sp. E17]|uniref:mechanosensitive ion channel family protein n=1 Tax=Haliea sp. E17 TaxID=3401576 RepID=UPI003AADE787
MNENGDKLIEQFDVVADMFDATTLLLLLAGILTIWLLNWFVRRFCELLMERMPSRRFQLLQLSTLTTFVLYIGGTVVLIVGVLQPPKEFLIAVGGSIAVALGFALKDVAASLVSGIMLLFDRPFQVGDRVSFNDTYGTITAITLRSVRLQTLDDNTVTIPNSRFITDVVASGNMGAMEMMVTADFHLALDADIDQARDIIRQVIVTSRFAFLKKPVTFSIEEVALAERIAIRLRAKAYVLDVDHEKDFKTDITRRATRLLLEAGIQRPTRD